MLAFALAFFSSTLTAFAQVADHTGTLRICSVLTNTTTAVLASTDSTVPEGTFSLSIATTTSFSSPVATHTFNAQAFAHNTTVDGVPMHCTLAVTVPFGQYYYNDVAMGSAWSPSKFFDSASDFSLNTASVYTNGLFTIDPSDDVLINTSSDGMVVVNETQPNRTVIVVTSYETSQGHLTTPPINAFCANGSSLTYPEFVHARTVGRVTYALATDVVTNKATVEVQNTTGCTIPMSLSVYKMFDGSHLSTQEYFSGTPEILATSTTTFSTKIPTCLAQVDFWYGTAPTVLVDNYNYGDLPLPVVLTWALPRMTGVGAGGIIEGPYCSHAANTAPIITLVGINPTILTVGTAYTEPGATAHDLEDGNITSRIVITGTVNTLIPGSYTLTYTVTDSGGLSASTTRTVIVLPIASCVANTNMISNGGFESPVINHPLKWGSIILSNIELFWTSHDTVVYPYVELQAGYTEGNVQWLPHGGIQYAEIDGGTNHDVSQVLSTIPGHSYTLSYWASPRPNQSTTTNVMNISFNGQLMDTYIGAGSVMTDWSKRSYTFVATTTTTRISFTQGQNVHIGEGVFLDDVSVICISAPVQNTAPIITLVGNNPTQVTTGTTYTEAGATAHDLEDGNITSRIVITGTVNTLIPGTYTLTYTVTDSGGLSASTTRQVFVLNPIANACVFVSDISTTVVNGGNAVLTYNENPGWIASISGASWIWSTYKVIDPSATTTTIFKKTFHATSTPVSAVLKITADNTYIVKANGTTIASNLTEFNYQVVATYDISSAIVSGINTVTFEVSNMARPGTTPEVNPAGLLYRIELSGCESATPVNTPPTITLVGSNPAAMTVGHTWLEPGATAHDLEDGNITNKIIITGTVNINVVGTYSLVYTVTDSGGLSASTTRQVIVSSAGGGGGATTGSITFCSIYANKDNVVATSATGFPAGTFSIKLASTTNIVNSTIQAKTWTAIAFAPNRKIISTTNDADCVTYDNLPFATYYYSELGVSGTGWIVSTTSPKYNDQLTTPVNNVFDFFAYSGELFNATSTDDVSRNVNADGQIVVSADRREHTLVLLTKYEPVVTPPVCTVNCGGGGGGTPVCTSNCGGGGGGGGNGPIVSSLAITNEKVVEITPGVALVTWNTNLPATKEVGYGNMSQSASFIVSPFGYTNATARVSSPLQTIHSYTIAIEHGKTYYFRPVSTDGKTTVAGIELVLNPGTGGGTGETPTSCYYLFDWLKKGWNNNPVEVKKLQVFLRDLEGYPVQVTGIYDDQTITSLNAFQMRYKSDVLTPWGHTAPTSFTYITTKKKVNEIYCKMAFPVSAREQVEIDAFRTFLLGLQNAGVTIDAPTQEQLKQPPFIDTSEVGVLPGLSTSTPGTQGTLAGAEANSTSTVAGRLTASVIESSKKFGNFMAVLFTWPWDWAKGWFGGNDDLECAPTSVFSNWFNWILAIIILTMTYLWYRERQDNKKAAKLNEELELLNK